MKTIGVIGTGAASRRGAVSMIKDYAGDDDVNLVLALTGAQFTSSTAAVAKWAVDNDMSITAVLADGQDVPDEAEAYLQAADTQVKVQKVIPKFISLVADEGGTLMLAFDEEDEDTNLAMELAVAKGLRPLDLTDGLQPLFFADEEKATAASNGNGHKAPEPEPEPVVAEVPDPPKRTRRSRTAPAPVVQPVAVEEEEDDTPLALAEDEPDEAQQQPVVVPSAIPVPSSPAPLGLVEDVEVGRAVKVLLLALTEALKAVQEPKRGPGRPRKVVP